jgi:hypothetical protein
VNVPSAQAAQPGLEGRALRTPRSAAFAGIVFSLLLGVSLVTMRLAVPAKPADAGQWLSDPTRRDLVLTALALMPFAGIAFLWFIGVIRDRVGDAEDRFFGTLFLGSGLLFIAMLFAAEATAAGLVASVSGANQTLAVPSGWTTGQYIAKELMEAGLQIVGVFTIATSTILLRTGAGPRWLALTGFGIAALLLLVTFFFPWTALLFPIWVLVLSLDIVLKSFREAPAGA